MPTIWQQAAAVRVTPVAAGGGAGAGMWLEHQHRWWHAPRLLRGRLGLVRCDQTILKTRICRRLSQGSGVPLFPESVHLHMSYSALPHQFWFQYNVQVRIQRLDIGTATCTLRVWRRRAKVPLRGPRCAPGKAELVALAAACPWRVCCLLGHTANTVLGTREEGQQPELHRLVISCTLLTLARHHLGLWLCKRKACACLRSPDHSGQRARARQAALPG